MESRVNFHVKQDFKTKNNNTLIDWILEIVDDWLLLEADFDPARSFQKLQCKSIRSLEDDIAFSAKNALFDSLIDSDAEKKSEPNLKNMAAETSYFDSLIEQKDSTHSPADAATASLELSYGPKTDEPLMTSDSWSKDVKEVKRSDQAMGSHDLFATILTKLEERLDLFPDIEDGPVLDLADVIEEEPDYFMTETSTAIESDSSEATYQSPMVTDKETQSYVELITKTSDEKLLKKFVDHASIDVIMHVSTKNRALSDLPGARSKILEAPAEKLRSFLLEPDNDEYIQFFATNASDSQFLETIKGSRTLQEHSVVIERLAQCNTASDFLDHPDNALMLEFYKDDPRFATHRGIIEREREAIDAITKMRQADIAQLMFESKDSPKIDLFCRKSDIRDLIYVAMEQRELLDRPIVQERIMRSDFLKDFIRDTRNRSLVGPIIYSLSDDTFITIIKGDAWLQNMPEVQERLYETGIHTIKTFFKDPENKKLAPQYLKNIRFVNMLTEHLPEEKRAAFIDAAYLPSQLKPKIRLEECSFSFEGTFYNVPPTREKNWQKHQKLFEDIPEPFGPRARKTQSIHTEATVRISHIRDISHYYDQMSQSDPRVVPAIKASLAHAHETEITHLSMQLSPEHFALCYDALDEKLRTPALWKKLESHLLKLSEDKRLHALPRDLKHHISLKKAAIKRRKDEAVRCKRMLRTYLKKSTQDKECDAYFMEIAQKVRFNERLASDIGQSTCDRLYKLEAAATIHTIEDAVTRYSSGTRQDEDDLLDFIQIIRPHTETSSFKKLVSEKASISFDQMNRLQQDYAFNKYVRHNFAIEASIVRETASSFMISPHHLACVGTKEQNKIQRDGIMILHELKDAPAEVKPLIGDFTQIAFSLNAQKRSEQAQTLLDEIKTFGKAIQGAGTELWNQSVEWAKEMAMATAVGGTATAAARYIAPIGRMATKMGVAFGKIAPHYAIGSTLYHMYSNWDAWKEHLHGLKEALLEGKAYEAGQFTTKLGIDAITAALGYKIVRNHLTAAHQGGYLDHSLKAIDKGFKDARLGKTSKEITKLAKSPDGILKLSKECDLLLHHETDKTIVKEAIEKFSEVPGFFEHNSPLVKVLADGKTNSSILRGHLYELETALKYAKNGHTVERFGSKIFGKTANSAREFDIQFADKLIECKNSQWSLVEKSKLKLQALIAAEEKKTFIVHSKIGIPPDDKKWLQDNNISFIEDN